MTAALLSRRARHDVLSAARWIADDNPTAARAFRQAVERVATLIAEHPRIGHTRPELAAVVYRFLSLTGFPYIVVYNAERHPPLILRVLHGARDLPELLQDLR
jgi:toxin ParE1/3/4